MECDFGVTSRGEKAKLYTLKNGKGMEVKVSDYGAVLVQLLVPDQDGQIQDVVLGYDNVKGYEEDGVFFGAAVGRVANRIGGGEFTLNGKTYCLTQNNGENTLHGGRDFYNKRLWKVVETDENHVKFMLRSPDGDQGFPGNVDISITYVLTEENEVRICYHAISDQDTLLNMTNHSYFNLSGHASGTVLDQKVMIDADAYTRADAASIPTGELIPVENTPMDFRNMKLIGQDIEEKYEALILGNGYDHNWVLNGNGMRKVAAMRSDKTGIGMEVYTDLPGMQFYTANFLNGEKGKNGAVYQMRHAACFETQYFPDAVHKMHFEGPVLKAGESYETTTVYKIQTGI